MSPKNSAHLLSSAFRSTSRKAGTHRHCIYGLYWKLPEIILKERYKQINEGTVPWVLFCVFIQNHYSISPPSNTSSFGFHWTLMLNKEKKCFSPLDMTDTWALTVGAMQKTFKMIIKLTPSLFLMRTEAGAGIPGEDVCLQETCDRSKWGLCGRETKQQGRKQKGGEFPTLRFMAETCRNL